MCVLARGSPCTEWKIAIKNQHTLHRYSDIDVVLSAVGVVYLMKTYDCEVGMHIY